MPDLTPLPPLPDPPPFQPDSGRFARVAAVARRRRAVRASVPLGTAFVAVAVAVVSTTGAGGPNGLRVVNPATDPPSPSVSGTASRAPTPRPEGTSSPSPVASPRPGDPSPSPAPDDPTAPAAPPSSPTQRPTPTPVPSMRPVYVTAERSDVMNDRGTRCEPANSDPVNHWCARSRTVPYVRSGGPLDLVFEVCRSDFADGRLDFRDAGEVSFDVYADDYLRDRVVALLLTPDVDAGPHSVAVAGDRCARWRAPWQAVDQAGDWLPPDTYHVLWRDLGRDARTGAFDLTVMAAP